MGWAGFYLGPKGVFREGQIEVKYSNGANHIGLESAPRA